MPSYQGQGFLSPRPENSIRAEVKGVLDEVLGQGHGVAHSRLAKIRSTLQPLFGSLPKNSQGRLSGPVMRYAVRRYFSEEHAWIVKGFEPHAELVNTSDTDETIFQGKVPAFVRSVLEEKFAHNGFALEDVVMMVAAVERLTFDEVVRTMEASFWLNDRSVMDGLSLSETMEVLSSYLIVSMFDGSTDKKQHNFDKKYINLRYPHWDTSFLFLTDIAGSDIFQRSPSSNPFFNEQRFYFQDLIRMGERVSEEFGPWTNHECHEMKDLLMERDIHGSGRVKLADFYRKTQDGAWQFTEQSEYLRQLGALDESSPSLGPQVLIPNYITGLSNCITSAPYYAICCLNECDQIYRNLEAAIPASTATPSEIIKAVEGMPQSSEISAPLRAKLDEVAEVHNGNVPVHGRLVAQWLHFAFPNECPYPHEAGTISPKTPAEWRTERGDEADSVSDDEVKQIMEMDAAFHHVSPEAALKVSWTPTESLMLASTPSDESDRVWSQGIRIIMQVCMMISCVAVVLSQLRRVIQPDKKKAVEYDI
eukprot:gnl/MRDRNA2_/MRDRNA2_86302_c0_seq16.p1 gnl/MRDRNA2_/MRDRNA2_86302_c0~~gnl/MRDRNA2_/MRDRNA2_86302_c0_seq16.p1  ORF type:complete len:579 (+),score=110.81 gnl/MRDRNA2_/MRDRNA2_86302_c0_seq16:137-1738(+)